MLDGYVYLKHAFADGEHRRRFVGLIVGTMNRLAQAHSHGGEVAYHRAVGCEEYAKSEDRELAEIDEALLAFAHLGSSHDSAGGARIARGATVESRSTVDAPSMSFLAARAHILIGTERICQFIRSVQRCQVDGFGL